jgi:phosphoribosylaminoimidazolecarboxamide formyltransferase/IMP cyclohydrolase
MEKYAIISVSDKTNIEELAKEIVSAGYKIISSGGTFKKLQEEGISAIEVSEFTGEPEILQGRVKTLGRTIHAGLLANPILHKEEMQNIKKIDIVVCNFYPFEKKIKEAVSLIKSGDKKEEDLIPMLIENIDIGGPTMTWSAIKNHSSGKLIITDPSQYSQAIEELKKPDFSKETIKKFTAKAAQKTALYRMAVANFLNSSFFLEGKYLEEDLPKIFSPSFQRIDYDFRYGENPHQNVSAGYKSTDSEVSIFDAEMINSGKVPSYNNIADMNSALCMLLDFIDGPFKDLRVDIIMKHGNPCGVGIGEEAFKLACETDQVSRFGGIYATNKKLTLEDAKKIGKKYLEVILAPDFEAQAIDLLVEKDFRRRIFNVSKIIEKFNKKQLMINSVIGGIIVQNYNSEVFDKEELKCVSEKKPSDQELLACELSFRIVKHCNSNAIVLADSKQAIGLGVGQMSRVDSVNLAIQKAKNAGLEINNSVLASDAFFPKADGPMAAIEQGISGIIQPGGSKMDQEVIDLINEKNIFMMFTKLRHFKHSR